MAAGGQRWRGGLTILSSPVDAQVFDGGDGVVTGKAEGVAAPVGCRGGLGLACLNEEDRREHGVGFWLVSRATWPERVGGRLAARVHECGSGLAWGTREMLGCCCACSFGWRGREEGWSSRCSTLVPVQSKCDGGGLGCTCEAVRWGNMVGGMCLPA
jgi:hypothetical protein